MVAPSPLLFARCDVVIRNVDHAGPALMVITSEKVLGRIESHVTGRHRNVCVPAQIVRSIVPGWNELFWLLVDRHAIFRTGSVVDAIVKTVAQREPAHGPFRVIGNVLHVGRKE